MPVQKSNAGSNAKKPAPKKDILKDVREFGEDMKDKFLKWSKNFEKFRDIIKNNYELGRRHLTLGNLNDAILRFKFVTWLEPQHADAWYYLGSSYMAQGDKKKAREALRQAQKLRPTHEETIYMLAIASGSAATVSELPQKMPLALTREHFDRLAPNFNKEQLETFKYEGHILLTNAIRSCLVPGRIDHVVLELGVGTGLCGPLLRDVAAHMTGVDISGAMLSEAMKVQDGQGKKIYDALVKRELHEFLQEAPDNGYDIILAASVVSYIGDLQVFFQQIARVLKPGGIFAFTAEKMDGDAFRFDAEIARFRFSQDYLQDLATKSGLSEVRCKEASVYPEYAGWLCVFKK